ncbi:hypothetical protein WR25_20546 [Diploscapter pachys]|uniref:Uncharacterized protein n=1 Tax=Diploscapter pachys TaxID=2018661 RepID=A0A2A2KM70_9BILA|nr:hypothetical protein WR25_20546 [Diploscapter pachys]
MHLGEMRVPVDGMRGEIEAEGVLFLLHRLRHRPAQPLGQPDRVAGNLVPTEQATLTARPSGMRRGGEAQDRLGDGMNRSAVRLDRIERPRRGQRFELPLVDQSRIDAIGEVVEALERPRRDPLDDQFLHRAFADGLQRAQCIADREAAFLALPDRLHVELGIALNSCGWCAFSQAV